VTDGGRATSSRRVSVPTRNHSPDDLAALSLALGLRGVEDAFAERGIAVSNQTVRRMEERSSGKMKVGKK
jgi:hypothetical protein